MESTASRTTACQAVESRNQVCTPVSVISGGSGAGIDIHRVVGGERPASVDAMGPPLATLANPGADATFIDRTLAPGWQRTWYRAVAWSARDDLDGFVEGRSPSSTAVPVLAPPPNAPSITGIRVNEPGSTEAEVLVSWLTDAPFRVTAFGPHRTVIVARDLSGTPLVRLDATLDTLARLEGLASLPGPDAANRRICRVWTESADRLYAWLPRPAGEQGFRIEAKVIDPLGRIGRATADVPTLASTLPVIDQIDPDNGSPGGSFTIHGSNLLLHPGDSVTVLLDIPTDPDAPPNPGPLALAGTPTSTTITVTIPHMLQEGKFAVIVSRSDGAEAISEQTLAVRLLQAGPAGARALTTGPGDPMLRQWWSSSRSGSSGMPCCRRSSTIPIPAR